jgi:hypothetical protein
MDPFTPVTTVEQLEAFGVRRRYAELDHEDLYSEQD